MPPQGFLCKRCGKCCTDFTSAYQHSVDREQVKIWETNAPHILEWVELVCEGLDIYDCWISPRTHGNVNRCPWLRIYKSERFRNAKGAHCLIHEWKDSVCQGYPTTVWHGIITGCKGFGHLPEKEVKRMLIGELTEILRRYAG